MIDGEEFNKMYGEVHLVKLTTASRIHNGFEFKEGLNEDIHDFNPEEGCVKGGFYFCTYSDFGKWVYYKEMRMDYIWDVTVPNDAKVVIVNNKIKCDKFILSNMKHIWRNEILCKDAVKQNGYALRWVRNQTEDICLAAVKQDGFALQFIDAQTLSVCLAAVKQNGFALEWVKIQTEEICTEAVKQNNKVINIVSKKFKHLFEKN